jgi:transposase
MTGSLFSYVDLEERVGKDPLRTIRMVVNAALAGLSGEFLALYARMGRPSIPPEKLLGAMLLQVFYTIRSERQLMERLEFDLLFRWFVGMGVDDRAWDHSTFFKNRDRLLEGDVAAKLLSAVSAAAGEPTHLQADRGSHRLDQDSRRPGTNQVSRSRARRMGLHLRSSRLQSGSAAEAPGGFEVKAPANCRLIGRWWIVEADPWD